METMSDVIENIDTLKAELDALRPLAAEVVGRINQKLRIEWNYHSNAIEGNRLTLGETKSLILHGLTARGKRMRDHLDIEGHDDAVKAIEDAVKRNESLNEIFIRNLHKVLLKAPYRIEAQTSDGRSTTKIVAIGQYKTQPNNVVTSTGETYYYTPPDQVKPAMSDLIDWYRKTENAGEHPIVIAATFHYRFVRIHPFDDGNGRMARLLMNMILIKHGYTVAVIPIQERKQYIDSLEQADKSEELAQFIAYVAGCCEYSLNLHVKAARGEEIEDAEDIDKEISLFIRSVQIGTGEPIQAREYASGVLHPLYLYCTEKCNQFSRMFEDVRPIDYGSSIRETENQITNLSMEMVDAWPDDALNVSTKWRFLLSNYQAKRDTSYLFEIRNDFGFDGNVWKFSSLHLNYVEKYMGQDPEKLKRIFNFMLRQMMNVLADSSDDQDGQG